MIEQGLFGESRLLTTMTTAPKPIQMDLIAAAAERAALASGRNLLQQRIEIKYAQPKP